jgi:hypothetical protein
MNLATREQRVLDGIESALQAGEPIRAENLIHGCDQQSCSLGAWP